MQVEHFTQGASAWNSLIQGLPGVHVLQTWEWGQVKSQYGWKPMPLVWRDEQGRPIAAALVLQRTAAFTSFAAWLRVLYVPKGPLLEWGEARLRQQVLADLELLARRQGAIFVKIDPDVCLGTGILGEPSVVNDHCGQEVADTLQARGWRFSSDQIQFRNTVMIDLQPDEDGLLANMKQKTRYNIRLAERKGVHIRIGSDDDLPYLFRLYAETSIRDGFVIRDEVYYHSLWSAFMQAGLAEPLIAEVDGEPVAAIILFHFAGKAWYLYGMSRQTHREKMPNYLLQWEAMRRSKELGCTAYDLWGAPDHFVEEDPLWGVFRFKDGLGGKVVRHLGAYDFSAQPLLYRLYTQTLPRLLALMRRRGKDQTRRMVNI